MQRVAAGGTIFKEINIDRLSQRHVCRKWGLQVENVKWCCKINIESEACIRNSLYLNLMFMHCNICKLMR